MESAWEAVELAIEAAIEKNVGHLQSSPTKSTESSWFGPAAIDPVNFKTLVGTGFHQILYHYLECMLVANIRESIAPAFLAALDSTTVADGNGSMDDSKEETNLRNHDAVVAAVVAAATSLRSVLQLVDDLAVAEAGAQQKSSLSLPPVAQTLPEVITIARALRCALADEVFAGPQLLLGENAAEGVKALSPQTPLGALAAVLTTTLAQAERTWNAKRKNIKKAQEESNMSDIGDEEEKGREGDEDIGAWGIDEGSASSDSDEDDDEDEDGVADQDDLPADVAARCWSSLKTLGWLERPEVANVVASLARHAVHREVTRRASDQYMKPRLPRLLLYGRHVVTTWLQVVHSQDGSTDGSGFNNSRALWASRVDALVLEAFSASRISELYAIITEYPDSAPAVEELQRALEVTQQHGELASALRGVLIKRLLHPGATTTQIIDVYIAIIKVLRILDPSDAVLDAVCLPVRNYLRGRRDTVRSIVASLTDEKAELHDELQQQTQDAHGGSADNQDECGDDDETPAVAAQWTPRLRANDALLAAAAASQHAQSSTNSGVGSGSGSSRGGFDIVGSLISIYGSKELFVSEYRVMLAGKLLKLESYDTSREVSTLELLKLRFGDAAMHQCEIMVRDVDESKRLKNNIASKLGAHSALAATEAENSLEPLPVDATVVSEHFWPSLQAASIDGVSLHPRGAALLTAFNDSYAAMKRRSLVWREQLGNVNLDLEFAPDEPGGSPVVVSYSVSPLQATLILYFDDSEDSTSSGKDGGSDSVSRSASELSVLTGLDVASVMRRMEYWVSHGVVATSGSPSDIVYTALDQPYGGGGVGSSKGAAGNGSGGGGGMDVDDDDANGVGGGENTRAPDEVLMNYVCGMLRNLGTLPLERVHSMLKMYTMGSDYTYEKTTRELQTLLATMMEDEKIDLVDGQYKLLIK